MNISKLQHPHQLQHQLKHINVARKIYMNNNNINTFFKNNLTDTNMVYINEKDIYIYRYYCYI